MNLSVHTPSSFHRDLYSAAGFPVALYLPSFSPAGTQVHFVCGDKSLRLETAGFLRQGTPRTFVRSLHQFGSPFVDLKTFSASLDVTPPRPVYGPGTDRPILSTHTFHGVGTIIQRDDPQIAANFRRLSAGSTHQSGPVGWIRPGFPSVVHFADWHIDGTRVQGALASSIDRPAGFVILDPNDLVSVMGYSPVQPVRPSDLVGLIPAECMIRLLDWVEEVFSRQSPVASPPSASKTTGPPKADWRLETGD